jgi:hypothetical protein
MSIHGNILGGVASAVGLGFLGSKTAAETNKANLAANRETIAAQAANQARATSALNLTGPFGGPKLDPETGGFISVQPGGQDAATARSSLAFGDVGRAGRLNELGTGFGYTVPKLSDAQGIIDRENALQQTLYDKGLSDIVASRQRTSQGIQLPNSPFEAATADAIGRFAAQNRLGSERDAIDLYNKARAADIGVLQQGQIANQPQAGFPAFTTGGPGATAANVIAQTPPKAVTPDIGGAVPYQAAGGVVQDIMRQEQSRQENKNFLEALRLLGNQ